MQKLIASIASRLVIAVPYLWLLVFFLVPFFIVFKISLSQVAMSIPPYVPTFGIAEGLAANWAKIKQLSFDNYLWLLDDPLYYKAYLSSVRIAAISTFLTLLVAYPMAYGIARAPT
ncbi:binding-protein-dependent transport system inner membrane protein, partial [Brucella intermedia M86]